MPGEAKRKDLTAEGQNSQPLIPTCDRQDDSCLAFCCSLQPCQVDETGHSPPRYTALVPPRLHWLEGRPIVGMRSNLPDARRKAMQDEALASFPTLAASCTTQARRKSCRAGA
jgi:hypothetical protein